jgi:hypothetical protein
MWRLFIVKKALYLIRLAAEVYWQPSYLLEQYQAHYSRAVEHYNCGMLTSTSVGVNLSLSLARDHWPQFRHSQLTNNLVATNTAISLKYFSFKSWAFKGLVREALLKGKAHYSWLPCANQCGMNDRISASCENASLAALKSCYWDYVITWNVSLSWKGEMF